jgi:hypothetical protein
MAPARRGRRAKAATMSRLSRKNRELCLAEQGIFAQEQESFSQEQESFCARTAIAVTLAPSPAAGDCRGGDRLLSGRKGIAQISM